MEGAGARGSRKEGGPAPFIYLRSKITYAVSGLSPPRTTPNYFPTSWRLQLCEMVAVYLPDRSFQELFSAVRACSGVSCVVGMSDELPPPPVSKTRASQIALNFAGRVKHQMKDERKQVAWLPCPTASTTASPPGLLGHTPLLTRTARRAAVDRTR